MVVEQKPQASKVNAKAISKNMETGHQHPIIQAYRFGVVDSIIEEETIHDFTANVVSPNHDNVMPASTSFQSLVLRTKFPKKKNHSHLYRKIPTHLDSSPLLLENLISKENVNINIQVLSKNPIPKTSPNSILMAMQGIHANTGNPNGIPTAMHGMHEHSNDPNTSFSHEPYATQSLMQDMHAIPSFRTLMHVPISLNPFHHSIVSFPKIPKPPSLDTTHSSSRTNRGISLAEGHDNYLDGDPPDNIVIEGENHFGNVDGTQSNHSENGKQASVSDEDDSVMADSAMDMGAESLGLSQ
ncbi:hypothetical protein AB3S75_047208 [Citrus x aurantiifolia]